MKQLKFQISNLRIPVDQPEENLKPVVAKKLKISKDLIQSVEISRRALDARGRGIPFYELVVLVELSSSLPEVPSNVRPWVPPVYEPLPTPSQALLNKHVTVLGAGPCGLFAALTLARRGIKVTLIERGEMVKERAKSVSRLMGKREINRESNLCYGEGGAGTFSDGKLYSRIGAKATADVLRVMIDCGAPEDILINSRPHLGTDRLITLLKGMRKHLQDLGVELRYNTRVDQILPQKNGAELLCRGGERIKTDLLILAPGHSSRSLYRHLHDIGVAMEAKPFSVGFRIEHPQALINHIQYGKYAQLDNIPAADYRLAFNNDDGNRPVRVFSFCMCPGGSVVPTTTKENEVCVNGMSHAARSGHYANSAIVTELWPGEYLMGGDPVLDAIHFQESCERIAYDMGGGQYRAPASRLLDYLQNRGSQEIRRTSYRCGVVPADLTRCYPDSVHKRLRFGLQKFNKTLHGFASEEAVLIGVETRTSAPLRLLRTEALHSPSHPFLYPGGEGAGYAGGIVSAAYDGIRIGRKILTSL